MTRGRRGDLFEQIIEMSNMTYKNKGVALIQKIDTPKEVVRRGGEITSAYYKAKSTLDFIGVYNGIPIAFDAKETKNKTNFPLSNIREHQVKFIENWEEHGGQAFMIVNFRELDECYRLDANSIICYYKQYQENKGKRGFGSIPIDFFRTNCVEVRGEQGLLLHYLKGI